jgi:hypothetical protein
MRYLYGKIKAHAGECLNIQFSQPTRILIMPERHFKKYRDNLTFTYFGGHKESPYEFTIPKAGTWVVVIEKGTYSEPIAMDASISKITGDAPKLDSPKKSKKKKKKKEKDVVEESLTESTESEITPEEEQEEKDE